MSLASLASQAVNASRIHSSTPVLVMPRQVTFRSAFFVDLASELFATGVAEVRFDWIVQAKLLRNTPSAHLHFWRIRRRVAKIDRSLRLSHNAAASMELASLLSRPTTEPDGQADSHPLILGICSDCTALPDWSVRINAAVQLVTC